MSSKKQDLIEWRRSKVLELVSKGHNLTETANILLVKNVSTISRDLSFLRQQAKENIRTFIDEKIPFEYSKAIVALEAINKKAWEISETGVTDTREKIQALSLAKEAIITKIALLSDSTIINQAISFVEGAKLKVERLHSNAADNEDEAKESQVNTTF